MKTNGKGQVIEKFLDDSGLVLLNTGEPTRFGKKQRPTTIDLTLASPEIAAVILWEVGPDLVSDRRPLLVYFGGIGTANAPDQAIKARWNFQAANWHSFENLCKKEPASLVTEPDTNLDCQNIITVILNAAEKLIPKKVFRPNNQLAPWWSEKCTKVIQEKAHKAKSAASFGRLKDYI